MRDILIVAKFSMKDILRKKSFIVSTIIILLLIVAGFQIPRIIKNAKSSNPKVLIVDNENLFDNQLGELNNLKLDYEFIIEETYWTIKDLVFMTDVIAAYHFGYNKYNLPDKWYYDKDFVIKLFTEHNKLEEIKNDFC